MNEQDKANRAEFLRAVNDLAVAKVLGTAQEEQQAHDRLDAAVQAYPEENHENLWQDAWRIHEQAIELYAEPDRITQDELIDRQIEEYYARYYGMAQDHERERER